MGVLENTLEMIGWLAVREIIEKARNEGKKLLIGEKSYDPTEIPLPVLHIPTEKGKIPDIPLELPDGRRVYILIQGVFYRNTAHIYGWKKRYELISNYSGKDVVFVMHGGRGYWRQHSKFFLDKVKVGVEAYTTKTLEENIKRIGSKLKFDALKSLDSEDRVTALNDLKKEVKSIMELARWFEDLKWKIEDKLTKINTITLSTPRYEEGPTKPPMIVRYQDCQELFSTLTKDDVAIFEKIIFKNMRKLIVLEPQEIERLQHLEAIGLIKVIGTGPEREISLTFTNPSFGRARIINGATLLTILAFYPTLVNEVFTFLDSIGKEDPRVAAYLNYLRDIERLKVDINTVLFKIKPCKELIYTRLKKAREEELIEIIRETPGLIPYFNAQVLWSMTTLKNWNDVAREKACFKFQGRPINMGRNGEYVKYTIEQANEIVKEIKSNLRPNVDLDYMAKKLWECFFDALRGELKNPKYSFFKKKVIEELQKQGIEVELPKRVNINSDYVGLDVKIKDKDVFIRAKGSIDPGSQPGYLKAQIWAVREKYPVILVSDGPSLRLFDEDWGVPRCYAQPPDTTWELIDILKRCEKDITSIKPLVNVPGTLRQNLYILILDFGKVEREIVGIIKEIHEANKNDLSKTVKDLISLPEIMTRLWNAKLITLKKDSKNRVFISTTEEGKLYRNKIISYIKFNEWAPKLGTVAIGCSEDALALLTLISAPSTVPEVPSRDESYLFTRIDKLHKKACININKQILEEFAKNVGVHPRSRTKLVNSAMQAILIYMESISNGKISKGRWSNFFQNIIVPESRKLGGILTMYGYKYNGKRFLYLSQELNKILEGVMNG